MFSYIAYLIVKKTEGPGLDKVHPQHPWSYIVQRGQDLMLLHREKTEDGVRHECGQSQVEKNRGWGEVYMPTF